MQSYLSFLPLIAVLTQQTLLADGFVIPSPSTSAVDIQRSLLLLRRVSPVQKSNEWDVIEGEHDAEGDEFFVGNDEDFFMDDERMVYDESAHPSSSFTSPSSFSQKHREPFFAALSLGSSVRIQVGNMEQSRKAWKKRRRSGSPLLIPCSVLDVDRATMMIDSIVYLVQKFGSPLSDLRKSNRDGGMTDPPPRGFRPKDIALSVGDLCDWSRKHLRSVLKVCMTKAELCMCVCVSRSFFLTDWILFSFKHRANAMGYETSDELLEALWTKSVQKKQGIKLWKDSNGKLWLMARMSRLHAHRLASQKVLMEFCNDVPGEHGDHEVVPHTGKTRLRSEEGLRHNPLSAALRVSQRVVDAGAVAEGTVLKAVLSSYDAIGDAGTPLLRLALQNSSNSNSNDNDNKNVNSKPKRRDYGWDKNTRREAIVLDMIHNLRDIQVGDGPFEGKVVRVHRKTQSIYVDFGLGREVEGHDVDMERVLGCLSFEDVQRAHKSNKSNERNPLFVAQEKQASQMRKESLVNAMTYADDDEAEEEQDEDNDEGVVDASGKVWTVADFFTDAELKAMEAIEENEQAEFEEEEDITHLVHTDEQGNLVYEDPETGEKILVENMDGVNIEVLDGEDEDDADDDDDIFAGLTPEERLGKLDSIMASSDDNVKEDAGAAEPVVGKTWGDPSEIRVGDDVVVYVQAMPKKGRRSGGSSFFPQSKKGHVVLTVDPNVKPMKLVKKERGASKKLERLMKQVGGDGGEGSDEFLLGLQGTECDGVVKATSRTGDWYYVQPELPNLPVGVAHLAKDIQESLSQGDQVRVRLDGVDESRGQLAMTVTGKAP